MKEIVELLIKKHKTIATMESCTGGFIASSITDIEGASEVLRFSAITYSNEYKIKLGVSAKTIDTYSVYSHDGSRRVFVLDGVKYRGLRVGVVFRTFGKALYPYLSLFGKSAVQRYSAVFVGKKEYFATLFEG